MKKAIIPFSLSLLVTIFFLVIASCSKKSEESPANPVVLKVNFPLAEYKYENYYLIENKNRSLELVFNYTLDSLSIQNNIIFSDNSENPGDFYEIVYKDNLVMILFKPGFLLKGGWSYDLTIKNGIRSVEGYGIPQDLHYEFRTTSHELNDLLTGQTNDTTRTLIAVISDIHLGDQRSHDRHYSWFGKNADALSNYLSFVKNHPNIKQLVIQGDLFDEWLIPYSVKPFDSALGITNSAAFYRAIADAPVNKPIIDKFREIALSGEIDVVYVPGNHDMLITQDIVEELIPGIIWKSDAPGLGKYQPVDEILLEHGHRYDFFNCPQPLVNHGHMLPPGYFVSRLYASGMASAPPNSTKNISSTSGTQFSTAWTLAFIYTMAHFNLDADTVHMDSAMVQMTGIDNYVVPFSFSGAYFMYNSNIEESWMQTQTGNMVPYPMNVFLALLNGEYIYGAALYEYLTDFFGNPPKIISWGHSHKPDINVFPSQSFYTGIYANSGSWIDPDQTTEKTRTFLIINPGKWSGSKLDVVSLYQYNPTDNQATDYKPELLKEESIKW